MGKLIRDMRHEFGDLNDSHDEVDPSDNDNPNNPFKQLLGAAAEELYLGSTSFSKLRFIVRMLHNKALGGWTDKSFDMQLELLKEAFPQANLPKNFYEAKKMIKCLSLDYVCIDACYNDCILYWKQYENANSCPKCKTSRWKSEKKKPDGRHEHKVPRKVLRYFPIAKRLQRLFISAKSATDCRWHDEGRTKDGILRHPADSPAWKHFDNEHEDFSADSRNIRLIIETDGFNPFRSMNTAYSIWPVIAIPLNLPPWLCMKQPNFILSLLISGPKSPGRDIDVFLEPLIDDLHSLFEDGIRTYDASKSDYFELRAAVHSTISDLPGLATIAGCATSGEYGCPKCHSLTCSLWLNKGKKTCFMSHRRFLDENHRFRTIDKDFFDGKVETRSAPVPLTGKEVDALTENMVTVFGKDPSGKPPTNKRKRDDPPEIFKWRSIWFRLRYWKDLLQPHNLDAMHIEKNVCDNIVHTLLGVDRKTKDNANSRRDLEELNIRGALHPVPVGNDTIHLPSAPYSLSIELKRLFCQILKAIRFPDGLASDIRNNVQVKEKRIIGLKSHVCHILLQQLLPLAFRRTLPEAVCAALIRVSDFFKKIYSPVIRISDMEKLEEEIAETLSILEVIFLPSFFDMMVHLMVHLPQQVRLGGPVKYSSMYPVERFLCTLKGYVRTMSHPEGSIAEGYIFDECLTFCSRYLEGCETKFKRKGRNDVFERECSSMPFFNNKGRFLAGKRVVTLDHKAWLQAHRYILFNYDDISPYLSKHKEYLSSSGNLNAIQIDKLHHDTFHEWFKLFVAELVDSGEEVSEEIQTLAEGPLIVARSYGSYTINGYNFHTKSYDVDVNHKHLIHKGDKSSDEPFIMASQANQVYYVEDPVDTDWWAIRQAPNQRDLYDMFGVGNGDVQEGEEPRVHDLDANVCLNINLRDIPKTRTDVDGILVSAKEKPKEQEDRAGAYDNIRALQITKNTEILKSFGVPTLVRDVSALHQTRPAEKQRKKRSLEETIPESDRVLRSRSHVRHESDDEVGDETVVVDQEDGEHGLHDQKKERNVRKCTRMHSVYDRKGQPPVPVSFNEKGQPDGDNASEFANFIATHVKSHIPLGHSDWRLVDVEKKNKLMTTLRKYYVVDDKLKDYVMGTAHKKWKDFKADLKEKIYSEERTDEELYALFKKDTRVTPVDVKWLMTFWRSEEAKKQSEQAKKNREKQKVLHKSGSKSHARVTAEMHKENGFSPRRDEVFIRRHQSQKGKPLTKETMDIIENIEKTIDEHPELLEKTIQQGDIMTHVLGKEKNGYVRCIGLGPSASTLGMPGAQRLKSTRLQMAELEAEKAWRVNELLKEQVDEIKIDTKSQIDALMEEVSQLRMMVSQFNTGNNNSMLNLESPDSVGESAAHDEEHYLLDNEEELLERELREATEQLEGMKAKAALLRKKKESTLIQNREAAQHQKREAEILEKKRKEAELQKREKEAEQLQRKMEAEQLQRKKEQVLQQKQKEQVQLQKSQGAAVTQKNNQLIGTEVILYNVMRDHTPVAKGIVLSTDRKKIVGGRELGTECCEVVVNYIMKRDVILPRPVGNVTTIGQAQGRTIAWPHKHLEVQKSMVKQASPPQEE